MKTKIECPTNFIDLESYNLEICDNPDCLIVDPGTDFYLDESYFKKYKNLKIVGTPSTGVSHIDTDFLKQKNIKYFCLLDDRKSLNSITASAEYTWMHIMNGFRRFLLATRNIREWRSLDNENFLRTNELSGKNILIIGLGRIGKKIKRYSTAFEMNVDYYDPYVIDKEINRINSLKNLKKYDCISINCYLNKETHNLIDESFLEQTGTNKKLVIVNTSRGEVVNEEDLYSFLQANRNNVYYGCDVLCNEQDIVKLRKSKIYLLSNYSNNVVITPHVAGATIESQTKAFSSIVQLCKEYYEENSI